ncbi:MAG: choice-of-anchor Q domain-containing protein [Chthoniobacterales bacterium]
MIQLALGLVLGVTSMASAATLTVTNTNDSGAGSLRAAISSAAASGDTIDFNLSTLPATITLTSAELAITKSMTIRGPGADQLTISGNNARRVIRTTPAGAGGSGAVTVSGLTIANGAATANGGGIEVALGSLALFQCVVANNTAPANGSIGGGIMAAAGTRLSVIDSVVRNNSSTGLGGGIGTPSSGPGAELTLARSTVLNNATTAPNSAGGGIFVSPTSSCTIASTQITSNSTAIAGGGIYNLGSTSIQGGSVVSNQVTAASAEGGGISSSGTLLLTDASISGNTVVGSSGIGGGLGNSGTATITRCTFSGNSATGRTTSQLQGGGGISNSGTLSLTNSTVSTNSITTANGGGGGILNTPSGVATLTACTIAFNSCVSSAGGGVASGSGGTVTCRNNIIAPNTAAAGPNIAADVLGTFTTQGFNLIGTNGGTNGFNNVAGDLVGGTGGAVINPLLDPLADNGGPTRTHALQTGSPAIDVGSPGFGVVTDQRGSARFIDIPSVAGLVGGNASDIGAVESAPLQLTTAASRKVHGAVGPFDVTLPLAGSPGVEDRNGGGSFTVALRFTNPLTAGTASVSAGMAIVDGVAFSGNEMLINLSGVTNAQLITLTADNVADTNGAVVGPVSVTAGFLVGDTNGTGIVNSSDIALTKAQSGAAVTAGNFRQDVNLSGSINATDIGQVKGQSGTFLPALLKPTLLFGDNTRPASPRSE